MHPELQKLVGGDRRSVGRAEEVVRDIQKDPGLFDVIFKGMLTDDPVVRMRAADVTEKVTVDHPEYLEPYKELLLRKIVTLDQQEIRWHVAQLLPRLQATPEEQAQIVQVLLEYMKDSSRIVRVNSLQALADIALKERGLKSAVKEILEVYAKDESPAVRSRCMKLLKSINQ